MTRVLRSGGPQGPAGPKGDTGDQGPAGPAGGNVGNTIVVSNSTSTSGPVVLTAACPAGSFAVGGGGLAGGNKTMLGEYPSNSTGTPLTTGAPTHWSASFTGGGASTTQTVYVICASAPTP